MQTFSSGMEAERPSCREAKSVRAMTDKQNRTVKGMLLSLVLHAFCVTMILLSVNLSAQYPEISRILLSLEEPGGSMGDIRQETEEKKAQSAPVSGKLCRRSQIRKAHSSDLTRVTDKVPVEPATDAVPMLDKTPSETAAPLKAVSSGIREEATIPAVAGTGIGEGSGSHLGSGAGSIVGAGKGNESGESLKNRYLREHFAYIRNLILKNLSYPPLAKRNGWQGKLKVSFIIREDGKVECIRIIESSGYFVLDRNVVETIREVQPFPKPPVRAELVIPVTYTLRT